MELDYYLSHCECQVETSERQKLQSMKESSLTLKCMEIQHLDYVLRDCQEDLHVLCRRMLSVNYAVTKQLWREEKEKGIPSEDSWKRVVDRHIPGYHTECRLGACFDHMKFCIIDYVMQSLQCRSENDVKSNKQPTC